MKQLEAQNLTVTPPHGQSTLLSHIALRIHAGEVVALLGANGAGKSTLSACLAGDEVQRLITSGQVLLNGSGIHTLSAQHLAKQRAVLTQHPSLNVDLLVQEVIEMGAYPFPDLSPEETRHYTLKALDWMEIVHLQLRRYQKLSGGEKQRVQFARILVQLFAQQTQDPRYCLLDEPTSSLDPKNQQLLLNVLRRLATELNIGVLVILHDVNLAALHCDKLVLLAEGRIIAQGPAANVLTPDNLEIIYGLRGQTIPHPFIKDKVLVVWC